VRIVVDTNVLISGIFWDDKFIACALSAGASYLVSGDDDLLSLREVEGVHIVTAVAWLKIHG
jgi:predicted nucleic acid-binding protein